MAFLFMEAGMISRFLLHHVRGRYPFPRVTIGQFSEERGQFQLGRTHTATIIFASEKDATSSSGLRRPFEQCGTWCGGTATEKCWPCHMWHPRDSSFANCPRSCKLTLVEPKSAKSRRTITLPPFAAEALLGHYKRQAEERAAAGSTWQENGFMFTTTIGTPLDPSNVTKYFKRVLGKTGSRDQRFHDLRHCCASLLIAQGVSMRTVMEILGHSQMSLTMNTYAHVFSESKKQAATQLDDLLGLNARAPKVTDSIPVGVNSGVIEVDLVATDGLPKAKNPTLAGANSK